jgi:5'(3')-deoxyribonucleotidase
MTYQPWLRANIPITKPIVLIDLDGVLANFDKRHDELKALGLNRNQAMQDPRAFEDLEPMEGAIEHWHLLQEDFETYILSTAPWSNPGAWSSKRVWVEKYLGKESKKKLILSHNKGLVIGDYLIDDRIANGVGDFRGLHVHFGTEGLETWEKVFTFIKECETKKRN